MATKFFVVDDSVGRRRLIEAKSQRAVERFLCDEFLADFIILKANAHKVADLMSNGVAMEQAFEPEDPDNAV